MMSRFTLPRLANCTPLSTSRSYFLRSIVTSASPVPSYIEDWVKEKQRIKRVERDFIDASSFNLMGNTLNDPIYHHNHFPTDTTEVPAGWHLAYFPPRCPEADLAKDGYEQDWKPPSPFDHRMWAGGKLRWNQNNRLRVGQEATMVSRLRQADWHPGGRRGDALFTWVDKTISNQDGWSIEESRCWVFVKNQVQQQEKQPGSGTTGKSKGSELSRDILDHPDFSFTYTPSPISLFRFSALTFNSHLIHYDQQHARQVEHQEDCLVHGPLSLVWMLNTLHRHVGKVDTNKYIESVEYRCLRPLVVRQPVTVAGKQQANHPGDYDLWVLDAQGNIAVLGVASVGFAI